MLALPLLAEHNTSLDFRMSADKRSAYLGEPIKITFRFSYPIDLQVAEANFAPPTFHDFWVKPGRSVPDTIQKGRHIYRLEYLITPQKAGDIEIEPARMDIGILRTKQRNTLRFERVKWKSIFSNPLRLRIEPLPGGTTLFGHYTLTAAVDRNRTRADRPVNLTLTVKGSGNLEEIPDFDLNGTDALVYSDKPKISTRFKEGRNEGSFTQKFALLSEHNYTIPALSLTYFDSDAKAIHTIRTAPIPITVEGESPASGARLEKAHSVSLPLPSLSASRIVWIVAAIGGFVAGIAATLLWMGRRRRKAAPKRALTERIRKARDDKTLLALLLPYTGTDAEIDRIISRLEANLYRHAKHKIDRKKVAKLFDRSVTLSPQEAEMVQILEKNQS